METVDLRELAEQVVAHLAVLAEEKGQTLVVERGAAPTAPADRVVLRQALINLVDNAIKFTPVGGQGCRSGCRAATASRSLTCQTQVPVFQPRRRRNGSSIGSMPTVSLPGIGARMLMRSARVARARSRSRLTILSTRTPFAG